MRIESVLFGNDPLYGRMADALKLSAKINSPKTPLIVRHIRKEDDEINQYRETVHGCYLENYRKTKHHRRIVMTATEGSLLCLIDCDTLILQDMSIIEKYKFDFAYTIRPEGSRYPFNTGVVFVRISEKTRDWYDKWLMNVQHCLEDPELFKEKRNKYGRINQCGLGMLLERPHSLKLLQLKCEEWNSIKETWLDFGNKTKVLHILGELREAARLGKARSGLLTKLLRVWKQYDAENAMGRTA